VKKRDAKKYMAIARFRAAKEEKQLRAKSEEKGGERAGAQVRECGMATEKTGAHETIPGRCRRCHQYWSAQAAGAALAIIDPK
jgi:hypothetical protein